MNELHEFLCWLECGNHGQRSGPAVIDISYTMFLVNFKCHTFKRGVCSYSRTESHYILYSRIWRKYCSRNLLQPWNPQKLGKHRKKTCESLRKMKVRKAWSSFNPQRLHRKKNLEWCWSCNGSKRLYTSLNALRYQSKGIGSLDLVVHKLQAGSPGLNFLNRAFRRCTSSSNFISELLLLWPSQLPNC